MSPDDVSRAKAEDEPTTNCFAKGGSRMESLKRIFLLGLIPITIIISTLLMGHFQTIYRHTFNFVPFGVTFVAASVILGILLGLDYMSLKNNTLKHVKIDWMRLCILGIPALYFLVLPMTPAPMVFRGTEILYYMGGILLGYSFVTSIRK
jgi:hypothetical protein